DNSQSFRTEKITSESICCNNERIHQVAWEHEEYKEKAKAERLRKELGLDDSRDSRANGREGNQTEFVSFDDHISVMESARGSATNVWSTSSLPGIVYTSRIGKSTSNSGAKS
ncbi:unnamed protein product, partial [Anisakis simplex]|uniref:LsmAD domain-containing protein n=1 Tax=Anisakis simplex TaxID=6269 RepID=A0A0M3J683_ANISI